MASPLPIPTNSLRIIIKTTAWIFVVLLVVYIGLKVVVAYNSFDAKSTELVASTVQEVRSLASVFFDFVRPFIQLVIILLVLEWLLNKFGLSFDRRTSKFDWNVQTIIALVVVGSFALAALSGVEGAGMLKDVALVVVGFYFGTQKRVSDILQGDTKTTITEEHTNERGTTAESKQDAPTS
jgi:hypothetical protein